MLFDVAVPIVVPRSYLLGPGLNLLTVRWIFGAGGSLTPNEYDGPLRVAETL